MDATQMISDSILESDEEENEENENKRGRPMAKLCILRNQHIPESELPLFLGDNVLGRDPNTCAVPLAAPSISKQHATICISVYRKRGCNSEVDIEALVWDLGSMNGTRKGRLKLTPNVRYNLSDGDSLEVADIPCQYVSCTVNTVFSQGDTKTPVSRNLGVKATFPDAFEEKGDGTNRGCKKCVNGGAKAGVSLTKTPVRTTCLSLEQTPTQPQGTLVPESDSDSEDERRRGGTRGRRVPVSDSDSHKSSPTCSTLLSPINKTVPESEDESPITPSSSTKNRPYIDVGRQQLTKKQALENVEDSEEEGGVTPEERESSKIDEQVPSKHGGILSVAGKDEFTGCTPDASTHAIPTFTMDSDTDMEGDEEEMASAGYAYVSLNTNAVSQPPNTGQFHVDSDTDVEDKDALEKVPKTVISSDDGTKPPHVVSIIQPEGVTVDSDTDVDDSVAVLDSATKAKPMSCQSTHIADSTPSTQLKDFNLDSDTDVDEEEERECEKNIQISKMDPSHTKLNIKSVGPESSPAASHSLHLDSDTDDEAIPAISECPVVFATTESCITAGAVAELDILPDSDTDVKDDSHLVIPVHVTTMANPPANMSEALQSDSDADTDLDESGVSPVGDLDNPADLREDSDTDAEIPETDEDQIPDLCREQTPGLLLPLLQNCSTPVQISEEEVEQMETQAFMSPSSVPFKRVLASAVALSSCQEDEDLVVAETQSFVVQTGACQVKNPDDHILETVQAFSLEHSGEEKEELSSFPTLQLGLSDSSYLQCQAQSLAMESTQAFVPVDGSMNQEDIQAYAVNLNADGIFVENAPHLEATQAYEECEEPAGCPVEKDQLDFALEATQAYISEAHIDLEDEKNKDERKNSTSDTLGFTVSSSLAMAETQLMSAFEDEEILSVGQIKSRTQNETEEREESGELSQPQQRPFSKTLFISETQPMHTCDDEDVPDEQKAKPPQLSDSEFSVVETQPLCVGVADTQPVSTSGNVESDVEDLVLGQQNINMKVKKEKTQTLSNSEISAIGTQPMDTLGDGANDEEDSIPVYRKRRAGQLQLEETQPLNSSEMCGVDDEPMRAGENEESSDEDSIPDLRKRKAKPLQLDEEQTQPLSCPEASTVEKQPIVMSEEEESSDGESVPGPHKRRAKALQLEETQSLTNSEVSTLAIPPLGTKTQPERVRERQSEAGTSVTQQKLKPVEQQEKFCDPPKRQTRGKNKALPANRGKRGSSRSAEDEGDKEEEVGQPRKARGKKSIRQQKDDKEEEQLKSEINEHTENNHNLKEKDERSLIEKGVSILRHQEREKKEKSKNDEGEQEVMERQQGGQEQLLAEDMILKEKIDRERKDNKQKKSSDCEKAERKENEKLKREEKAKERKEQQEKRELDERVDKERKEQDHQARLEREERERLGKEKEAKEKQMKEQQENKPTRGRRAARTTETEQDSAILTNDVPARRTRSHSNSSNSVSSERSATSINTQVSRGRGRGRGVMRTSEPPQTPTTRSSNRRRTVAVETAQQDSSPQGLRSRSNSANSLNSEISSCSLSCQVRGRGGSQRGRGRKTEVEPDSSALVNKESDQKSTPKPAARGQRSRKTEGSSNVVFQEARVDSQQATTTRGQQQASSKDSEPAAAVKDNQSTQEGGLASKESPLPKRNVRGRSQKAAKNETIETRGALAVSDGNEAEGKKIGRKRELSENEDSSSSSKIFKANEKVQATEENGKDLPKDKSPYQAKRRGRASSTQVKKSAKESPSKDETKEGSEELEVETVKKRATSQPSVVQKKKREEQDDCSGTSASSTSQDANVSSQPQTPSTSVSRKRQTPADSSPLAKTPRSSSASPAVSGRVRAASQAYKVLFTGVVDEAGERVLARLGGSMAKGVADMNCLVTDKVRRTLKFLCAVSKGIPIVTTDWLEKSGKAGSFLPPNAFVVKDPELENKFSFSLQESLRVASSQRLLQGYKIHVTKSVKPEPVQMKDIISCSGATFLPKMPSSHKPHTVVISCEEDWPLCGPAVAASLPIVSAEFILTGVLQQKLDFQTHVLSAPAATLQPTGGRGRGRKKS